MTIILYKLQIIYVFIIHQLERDNSLGCVLIVNLSDILQEFFIQI